MIHDFHSRTSETFRMLSLERKSVEGAVGLARIHLAAKSVNLRCGPPGHLGDRARVTGNAEVIPINLTVAVGTTIADRPPRRSVRARLRIRLLLGMNGGETCCWPHTVQSLGHAFPALCRMHVGWNDVLLSPCPSLPSLRRRLLPFVVRPYAGPSNPLAINAL